MPKQLIQPTKLLHQQVKQTLKQFTTKSVQQQHLHQRQSCCTPLPALGKYEMLSLSQNFPLGTGRCQWTLELRWWKAPPRPPVGLLDLRRSVQARPTACSLTRPSKCLFYPISCEGEIITFWGLQGLDFHLGRFSQVSTMSVCVMYNVVPLPYNFFFHWPTQVT